MFTLSPQHTADTRPCCQTLLLWLTYVCCGLADSVRGPTLMDLRDLVQEDISSVASIFAFKSFGGLIGILGPGLLLDRQAGYLHGFPWVLPGNRTVCLASFLVNKAIIFVHGFPDIKHIQI